MLRIDSIYESIIIFGISITETRDMLKKQWRVFYGLDGTMGEAPSLPAANG